MRDVAEEASVALGTVYRYFVSKEHLFAAVLMEWSESLQDRVQKRTLRGETPAERLDDMMSKVLRAFERWPQFFGVIMLLEITGDEYAHEQYTEFAARTTGTFAEALEGLDPELTEDVLQVVNAILAQVLRLWTQGLITMKDARRRMSRAIELVLTPTPPC